MVEEKLLKKYPDNSAALEMLKLICAPRFCGTFAI
jgi:hypothetical protein